jgi:hypothetical protein
MEGGIAWMRGMNECFGGQWFMSAQQVQKYMA